MTDDVYCSKRHNNGLPCTSSAHQMWNKAWLMMFIAANDITTVFLIRHLLIKCEINLDWWCLSPPTTLQRSSQYVNVLSYLRHSGLKMTAESKVRDNAQWSFTYSSRRYFQLWSWVMSKKIRSICPSFYWSKWLN